MTMNTGMGIEQDERDLEPEETDEYLESAAPEETAVTEGREESREGAGYAEPGQYAESEEFDEESEPEPVLTPDASLEPAAAFEPEASRDDLAAPYIGPGPVAPDTTGEREPESVPQPQIGQPVGDAAVSEHSVRMSEIQLTFIDDPRKAAQDADSLVDDLLRGLTADLARRRTELGGEILRRDDAETAPHTEELRVAVQRSRGLIDLLAQAREQVRA